MLSKAAKGKEGELLAQQYLIRQAGLKIIERNWRCFLGEIDIVANDPKEGRLIFVEVKSRAGHAEDAWESVHEKKQAKLKRLAMSYLKAKGLPQETPLRFDVAVVDLGSKTVSHDPDAFNFDYEF